MAGLLLQQRDAAVVAPPLVGSDLPGEFCEGKGIRIPTDLSVFVIDGSELMEWFTPQIARMPRPVHEEHDHHHITLIRSTRL